MKLIILAFGLIYSGASFAQTNNCLAPWGSPVTEGMWVMAYKEQRPTGGNRCESQIRTCRNGFLDGYYLYQFCQEDFNCNDPDLGWIPNMGTITAYLNPSETGGNRCQSETRQCQYGRLTGSFRWRFCNETH